jgi:RNA polymerase sigma factor (sigma-70 family)
MAGMAETPENSRERAQPPGAEVHMHELKLWFVREVLPLEADLLQFLQHHGRNRSDLNDLRQEVYLRAYESARQQLPQSTRPFVFAIARNILVDQFRRERIILIDGVPDFESIEIPADEPGPDRSTIARDELRRLYAALDRLPPRCREALVMRRVDDLSRREIAQRMGIAEKTVKRHLNEGLRLLVAMLYAEHGADS